MPEFVLDHGTKESASRFAALDSFTQGYIEAMFFTSTGTGDDGDLEGAHVGELAPETWEKIVAICAAFQKANRDDIEAACECGQEYDETRAGHDLWYTENGHGVGYWDRDLGVIGDRLTKAAEYNERNLYRGEDGLLHLD